MPRRYHPEPMEVAVAVIPVEEFATVIAPEAQVKSAR